MRVSTSSCITLHEVVFRFYTCIGMISLDEKDNDTTLNKSTYK